MPKAGSLGQVALRGLHKVEVCPATDVRRAAAPKRNVANRMVSFEMSACDRLNKSESDGSFLRVHYCRKDFKGV